MIYDDEIDEFTIHMEHKLLVHKAKGGVDRLGVDELMDLLKDGGVQEVGLVLDPLPLR